MKMSIYEFTSLKFDIVFSDKKLGKDIAVSFYPTEEDEWETIVDDECEYDVNLWIELEDEGDYGQVRFIAYRVIPQYENGFKMARYWSTDEIVCDSDCKCSTITVVPLSMQDLSYN